MNIGQINPANLAKTHEEYASLLASDADWMVRSVEDVKQLRRAGQGAFAIVPERDFDAFISGLAFNQGGGLAGAHYRPLMHSLTLSEIFEVFAHFGISQELLGRTLEYRPAGGGDCEFSFWDICIQTKPR